MSYVKWGLIAVIVALVAAFFHYSLPQRDVVRIVGTDVVRMNDGGDANVTTALSRYVASLRGGGRTTTHNNRKYR